MYAKYSRAILVWVSIFTILILSSFTVADSIAWEELVKNGLVKSMADLEVEQGSPNLCVLTDASYMEPKIGSNSYEVVSYADNY